MNGVNLTKMQWKSVLQILEEMSRFPLSYFGRLGLRNSRNSVNQSLNEPAQQLASATVTAVALSSCDY